jgi:hypothetical protein
VQIRVICGKKMGTLKFKSKLEKIGSWTVVVVPIDAKKTFGSGGYIRIKGRVDSRPFTGLTLMPMGNGNHYLPVNADFRKSIKKDAGDSVVIEFEKDNEKPVITLPVELKEAFKASKEAKKLFDSYSDSMRREYCNYISEGKKKETREKRAVDAVLKLEKLYIEKNKKHGLL